MINDPEKTFQVISNCYNKYFISGITLANKENKIETTLSFFPLPRGN